jgi:alpha-beta hydrolase superfamily lysophospholipase
LAENPAPFTVETFSTSDSYPCHYRRYPPSASPKGHVVCIHGIQSHAGWYEYSCTSLASAGWEVSFLDRRGSGLNDRDRGDTPNFRRLLDDIAEFVISLRATSPALPVFLEAISWGGKLGVAFQQRHQGRIDGLILVCPGICPKVRTPIPAAVRIALARVARPRKLFPIPLTEPELFTDTPRWQQFIRDDPLSLRCATARLLLESFRLDAYLRLIARSIQVPTLLLLAEQDRIIDNARTRRYLERSPATDKQIIEYAGAHHTLEFEPEPERFVDDMLLWLDRAEKAAAR